MRARNSRRLELRFGEASDIGVSVGDFKFTVEGEVAVAGLGNVCILAEAGAASNAPAAGAPLGRETSAAAGLSLDPPVD